MKLNEFTDSIDIHNKCKTKTEMAKYLAFFHLKNSDIEKFSPDILKEWFDKVGLSIYSNKLFKNIKKQEWSRNVGKGFLSLNGKCISTLEKKFPNLKKENSDIECVGEVISKEIYYDIKEEYITHICNQVNWAYEARAYDACAVMMRRLLEILLIHNFIKKGIDDKIKGKNHYYGLDAIIDVVVKKKELKLDPKVDKGLEKIKKDFKKVGDYSAHEIRYICKKSDISPFIFDYKVIITHLLDCAGFKN